MHYFLLDILHLGSLICLLISHALGQGLYNLYHRALQTYRMCSTSLWVSEHTSAYSSTHQGILTCFKGLGTPKAKYS
jgi:hypothetical protein